jgi:signal peptidase I
MHRPTKANLQAWLKRQWREWRGTTYFFLFVVIPVRSVLADWNWVPTGSMNPTILEGDLVYVNKAAYDLRVPLTRHRLARWSAPQSGDIVVFFSPEDNIRLVKRVIGLPGDSVELRNNALFLNDEQVSYSPLPEQVTQDLGSPLKSHSVFATEALPHKPHAVMGIPQIAAVRNFPKTTVPAGHYFVLGDNRDNSKDSRFIGFVERDRIIGRAQGVMVSFNKLDTYQPRWSRFLSSLQ